MSQKTPKSLPVKAPAKPAAPAKAEAAKPAPATVEAPKPVAVRAAVPVEAPKPVAIKAAVPVEAPKPVAVKAAAPVEAPKPVVVKAAAPAEAPKPAAPAAELKAELLKTAAPAPHAEPAGAKIEVQTEAKAEPAPAPAAQKGQVEAMTDTVRNTANEATDRAQALFGDMNARAKDAMEKSAKLFQELGELNKGNLEAVVESSRRAAKGVEAMAQNAADYARSSFERQNAALKSFAAVKSPTEFFQLQNDFVRSAFDSMVAETSKNSEAALKIAGDVFQPISNRFAVAAEKLKSAA